MRGVAVLPAVLALLAASIFPGDSVSIRAVYGGIPVNQFPEFPITVLEKDFYVIGYSEDFLNPAWVFYRVGPAVDLRSQNVNRPSFRVDRDTDARVNTSEYGHSGFQRGHLAPNFALGSRFGRAGARDTFVMSNVSPQFARFNDGQWGDLEEWIAGRNLSNRFIEGWADALEEIWVVVGPLFDEEGDTMPAGIPVPNAFFCIVLDELEGNRLRALAFVLPHIDQREDDLNQYLTTIDEIERRAGLDFFHQLPNRVENRLERQRAPALWKLPENPN